MSQATQLYGHLFETTLIQHLNKPQEKTKYEHLKNLFYF